MNYTSRTRLLGLPLFEYRTAATVDGQSQRGIARAWVAVGDVAFGVLLSVGGLAAGGIAIGGLSVGLLSLGGLAVGGLAWGGGAVGIWAVGGGALGLHAALGGMAVAVQYAQGGGAIARHANDPVAAGFFASSSFFRVSTLMAHHAGWLCFLVFLPWLAQIKAKRAEL